MNVTQSIIAFRSSFHTNYNDVIIKNNTELPVFGNEKSTDILTTDILCSLYAKQMRTHTHNHKRGDSNVKLTPYKIIKVGHWSVILEQRGENVGGFFSRSLAFLAQAALAPQQLSNGGREQQRVALCCKLATWFSLQRFTFRGTQCITPKPCQNNWNANQIPRGDFGLLGSSNLPSPVLWLIFVE